jgi:methylenetetrahydrofolate dehydrogenase (NADP+)/methenyltetrahydrofolate cyclohydrolase
MSSAITLDATAAAERFKHEIRSTLESLPEKLVLTGVLASERGPSATYAHYAQRACDEVGVEFRLARATRLTAETVIAQANADPGVHGIMVYYPVFGTEQDIYLRESVKPEKDIEGLHSFWARCLYANKRTIDAAGVKKAILPCTPLAIMKLIEAAGTLAPDSPAGRRPGLRPLENRTVAVFNRSEVVGRPLASMLAHDGARVYSFDIDGPLLFAPSSDPQGAHSVRETDRDRARALAEAEIVVTGVPSKQFELIRAAEIRPGAVCINFSTYQNFDRDVLEKASVFAPRVGPMTVSMALRNAVRLYQNTRS